MRNCLKQHLFPVQIHWRFPSPSSLLSLSPAPAVNHLLIRSCSQTHTACLLLFTLITAPGLTYLCSVVVGSSCVCLSVFIFIVPSVLTAFMWEGKDWYYLCSSCSVSLSCIDSPVYLHRCTYLPNKPHIWAHPLQNELSMIKWPPLGEVCGGFLLYFLTKVKHKSCWNDENASSAAGLMTFSARCCRRIRVISYGGIYWLHPVGLWIIYTSWVWWRSISPAHSSQCHHHTHSSSEAVIIQHQPLYSFSCSLSFALQVPFKDTQARFGLCLIAHWK